LPLFELFFGVFFDNRAEHYADLLPLPLSHSNHNIIAPERLAENSAAMVLAALNRTAGSISAH
jgi:hypothetical protein